MHGSSGCWYCPCCHRYGHALVQSAPYVWKKTQHITDFKLILSSSLPLHLSLLTITVHLCHSTKQEWTICTTVERILSWMRELQLAFTLNMAHHKPELECNGSIIFSSNYTRVQRLKPINQLSVSMTQCGGVPCLHKNKEQCIKVVAADIALVAIDTDMH